MLSLPSSTPALQLLFFIVLTFPFLHISCLHALSRFDCFITLSLSTSLLVCHDAHFALAFLLCLQFLVVTARSPFSVFVFSGILSCSGLIPLYLPSLYGDTLSWELPLSLLQCCNSRRMNYNIVTQVPVPYIFLAFFVGPLSWNIFRASFCIQCSLSFLVLPLFF